MTTPDLPKVFTATSDDYDITKFEVARTVEPLYAGQELPDNLVLLFVGLFAVDAELLFGHATIQNALKRGEQVVLFMNSANEHLFYKQFGQ